MPSPPLLALVGPTASGKSEAAFVIAEELDAEVASVDSMLLYRGMDVGTAKPTPAERARVPHHLVDIAEPSESLSVWRFQLLAREALAGIASRGRCALLVGGSGLHFRSIVDDLDFPATDPSTRVALEAEAASLGAERMHQRLTTLDPEAASKIEPGNVRRTVRALEVAAITGRPFSSFAHQWGQYPVERVRAAGVTMPPDALARRIAARVSAMIDHGFIEEVRGLVEAGLGGWLTSSQAIGYAEMARHLDGELSLDEARAAMVKRTRALARRQLAWFRRDPRIRWFEAKEGGAADIVGDLVEYLSG